jgi:hypothetical protein
MSSNEGEKSNSTRAAELFDKLVENRKLFPITLPLTCLSAVGFPCLFIFLVVFIFREIYLGKISLATLGGFFLALTAGFMSFRSILSLRDYFFSNDQQKRKEAVEGINFVGLYIRVPLLAIGIGGGILAVAFWIPKTQFFAWLKSTDLPFAVSLGASFLVFYKVYRRGLILGFVVGALTSILLPGLVGKEIIGPQFTTKPFPIWVLWMLIVIGGIIGAIIENLVNKWRSEK